MYDVGETVRIEGTFRDPDTKALTNPGTVTLTVTLPDGTVTSLGTVAPTSLGVYRYPYTTTVDGLHRYLFSAPGSKIPGSFLVYPVAGIISLDDAKDFLGITGTAEDERVRTFALRAEKAIASRVGPLTVNTYSERARGRRGAIILRNAPLVAVSSVTPVGTNDALDLTQIVALPEGVIEYNYAAGYFYWHLYDVTYTAGWASVPEDLRGAVFDLLKHLYTTQRGTSARPARGGGDATAATVPGAAYLWPFRVEQAIIPYELPGLR